jgi:two-component system, response regulator YesN
MRVLIIDDEKTTRETLRYFVPWAELGIDEVDTAANGFDALARISLARPDILLCDVRMPKMDGIELARRVRADLPDCVIVFLSGYSDADYLKAAIRVHAADYIDKPIDFGRVAEVMGQAVVTAREREAASARARSSGDAAGLAPLRKESLAIELLSPSADAAAIGERYDQTIAGPFLGGAARAAIIQPKSVRAKAGAEIGAGLSNLASSLNARPIGELAFAACRLDAGRLALVAGPGSSGTGEALESALARLAREEGAWIGLGPPSAPPLASSLEAASRALALRYYDPEAPLFVHRPGSRPPFALSDETLARFGSIVSARDAKAALALLAELRSRARARGDEDIGRVAAAFLALGNAIIEQARGWKAAEAMAERESLKAGLAAAQSLAAASGLVEELVDRCFGSEARQLGANRKIEQAKDYARSRFCDPDLSIPEIAAAVGLSETYLCTLFKREYGTTVLDFITAFRVEAAKALLVEGEDKVQAIAAAVGFRDPEWFSTLFKRVAGIPPSEYRERLRR